MKKILLIEDDDIIRENTEEILMLAQYEVFTAKNGKEGSELALSILPDLIICDILMPKLDGFGVIYVLSKNPKTASIPFIFLSAKTQKSDIRKGMELGADDYLCKPFDDNQLLTAIETRLKKHFELTKNNNRQDLQDSELESNALEKFLTVLKLKHLTNYKKKQIIYHEGDIAEYLYLIKNGKVKAYKTHDDGKEYITRIYKGGDIFGYTAIFSSMIYSDSVMSLEDSHVYKISKTEFLHFLSSNAGLLNFFIKLLSGDLKVQEEQLLSLAYNSVRKRTAEALLLLLEAKDGSVDPNIIVIARDDLASLAGTAVETVIRCLGEFKEDGIISTNHKEIIIEDKEALMDI